MNSILYPVTGLHLLIVILSQHVQRYIKDLSNHHLSSSPIQQRFRFDTYIVLIQL